MLKIAHRAAAGHNLENTLSAFKKALTFKVDMIEFDVHLTKDKRVVVIHDSTVNRTTNGKGKVSDLTFKEIRKLITKNKERIPTLEEVLDLVKEKCTLNIEVKDGKATEKVMEVLNKKKYSDVVISSSSVYALSKVKDFEKALVFYAIENEFWQTIIDSVCLYFLSFTQQIILIRAKESGVHTVNLNRKLAHKKVINFLHDENMLVNVWTLNGRKAIEKFKKRGVDGIFSDFPERL